MNTAVIVVIVIILVFVLLSIYLQFRDNFEPPDPMIESLKRELAAVDPRIMNIKVSKGDKSYTINKRHIYLCMKDENGEYYDRDSLYMVLIHEFAHVLTKSIGHTTEFDQNFKTLMNKAIKLGIYDPNHQMPDNYCNY